MDLSNETQVGDGAALDFTVQFGPKGEILLSPITPAASAYLALHAVDGRLLDIGEA